MDLDYGDGLLPSGIRSRRVAGVNGLDVHLLEAGFAEPARPLLLLLHGFPELGYSWRKVMPPLADAGFHVVAPDVRGYGRTTGWDPSPDADPVPFRLMNLVRDAIALVFALGHRSAAAVLGHDAGSPIAAWGALTRPDIFRSAMLLSTPFPGAPALRVGDVTLPPAGPGVASTATDVALAALDPPRRHYIRWFAGAGANADMVGAPQGLPAFIRAYYHAKSADWPGNRPHRLASAAVADLAELPPYYVMPRGSGMAATVAPLMPDAATVAGCRWLTDAELAIYAREYGRTGFDGGLWSYRRALGGEEPERLTHANRRIEVPVCFVSGAQDWGTWQSPGAVEAMERHACADFRGVHLVEGAGHWVQQERPAAVAELVLRFLQPSQP